VCISDDALFEANFNFLKAKKEQSFGDGFRGTSRENAHAFYIAKEDAHETIAEISRREKRRYDCIVVVVVGRCCCEL